jgi:hypothetical protein
MACHLSAHVKPRPIYIADDFLKYGKQNRIDEGLISKPPSV